MGILQGSTFLQASSNPDLIQNYFLLKRLFRFFGICDKCRELASYEAKFCSCIPAAYLPTKSREKEERGRESPLSTLYSSPYLLFLLIGNGERNSSFLSIFYSSSYLLFVLAFSLVRSVSISCHFLFLSPFPLNLNLNLNLNL